MKILRKFSNWVKFNVIFIFYSSISLVQLCIRQVNKDNSILKIDVDGWGQSLYLIDRFYLGQEYEVWLQVVLNNNYFVLILEIYFNILLDNVFFCVNNID